MSSIQERLVNVAASIDHISKNLENHEKKFQVRGIDDVYNAIHPILVEHGVAFSVNYELLSSEFHVTTRQDGSTYAQRWATVRGTFTFTGPDGDSIVCSTIGESADSSDKAVSQAAQAAIKYMFIQTFTIPTEGSDPDAYNPTVPSPGRLAPVGPPNPPRPAPAPAQASLGDVVAQAAAAVTPPAAPPAPAPAQSLPTPPASADAPKPYQARYDKNEEMSRPQGSAIFAIGKNLGWENRIDLLSAFAEQVIGRSVVDDKDFTKQQASAMIEHMKYRLDHAPENQAQTPDPGYESDPF